jgi:hypothetical protein
MRNNEVESESEERDFNDEHADDDIVILGGPYHES